MSLCDSYRPEFVARYLADSDACHCPYCANNQQENCVCTVTLADQQRETLNLSCEKAARALLFNPDAFVLHATKIPNQGGAALPEWDGALNQQCINLAVKPGFALELKLFAIGMLLSKAQQLSDDQQQDVTAVVTLSEELAVLMDRGILAQQFAELPKIKQYRVKMLKQVGFMRLALNLPMAQKMGMMLKLSELAIMQPDRLEERLEQLQALKFNSSWFEQQPCILQNLLIYLLYSDIFPGVGCENYGEAFFELARSFFQLAILTAICYEAETLVTTNDIVALISAWFSWRNNTNQSESGLEGVQSVLFGMSLL